MSSASDSDSFVTKDFESEFVGKKCSFLWPIHYSDRHSKSESSTFGAADDDFKWRLEYSVHNIHTICNEMFISLVLYPDCKNDLVKYSPISGKTTFSLLDNESKKNKVGIKEFDFKFESGKKTIQCCGSMEFIKMSTAEKLVSKGYFNVFCEITYIKTDRTIRFNESIKSNLSLDMERLLTNESLSDVTITVEKKNYPAHKIILRARSSVFDAMFRNNMQESSTNHITISDMDQETVQEMLHFIYTGKMKNSSRELAFKLLPAADKYDLKALKSMCTEVLTKTLSKDNAIEVLLHADVSNADQLIKHTLEFIKIYVTECVDFKNEVWEILTVSHPHLMKNMLAVYFFSNENRSES